MENEIICFFIGSLKKALDQFKVKSFFHQESCLFIIFHFYFLDLAEQIRSKDEII